MCTICNGMSHRDFEATLRSKILENGFTLVHVYAGGRRNPPFTYTVGLSRLDHPELICFGMHPDCAEDTLSRVALSVVRDGMEYDESADLSGLLPSDEGPAQLLRFPDSSSHLTIANRFYRRAGGPPVRALQLYWPHMEPLLKGRSE